ncbi:adenosylcobinamide-GDP ribazoletransferase [Pelagibius sp.]|uniref:adenosylcobinamide-GDP ribazoletransferase n=1 Tax=Pelagibius sp. TaxID=1931238 RepID=UPI0026201C4E|nr:adenosylcobinamide-GDP ribazoletransferase [Pelagibius sp.]
MPLPSREVSAFVSPRAWLCDLWLALALLTRLPVGAPTTPPKAAEPMPYARASRCYPLVGALVGLIAAAVLLAAYRVGLPPILCALLAVATTVLVTGALHEDGLADLADGFGGGRDRTAKLAIMRDSRIGSYGVLALIFSVALRSASLAALGETPSLAAAALIAAQSLSRGGLAAIMALLPLARPEGLAAQVGRPGGGNALTAILLAGVLALLLLDWVAALWALLACLLIQSAVTVLARRQIGGYTGDVLGAAQQLGEIAVLLVLATCLGRI